MPAGNMRYISGGRIAQLERFAIPIKFVTAERKAIPNAARKYTATVVRQCKKADPKMAHLVFF